MIDLPQNIDSESIISVNFPLTNSESFPSPIQKVNKVLAPIKPDSTTKPFEKGVLVKSGKNFGTVSKIRSNSHQAVQIAWWQHNSEEVAEIVWYPLDDLRVLKIVPLPLFVPSKTFLIIPGKTVVITEAGELIQFTETLFWLKEVDEAGYHLVNQEEAWLFPLNNFPGIPFACVTELPPQHVLEAAKRLNVSQLRLLTDLWLSLNSPKGIVEELHYRPDIEFGLKEAFKGSEYLQKEDYLEADLALGWQTGLARYIDDKKQSVGLFGFKVGSRVVQSWPNQSGGYDRRFGTVAELELEASSPVTIIWQDEQTAQAYSIAELAADSISPVYLEKLSAQVAYETSADGKFYQAVIGFPTKKMANFHWRSLKKELGYLSHLYAENAVQVQHLKSQVNGKYFYLASNPRQKGLTARLRHLQKVASWDLKSESNHF